jgi:hypothetical protein
VYERNEALRDRIIDMQQQLLNFLALPVQILTHKYKSTNTDAEAAAGAPRTDFYAGQPLANSL